MSKYLTFPDVAFKDRRLLLAALTEIGFPIVEEGKDLPLYGYEGDRRTETADIVIRRRHVGRASNDIGFARTPDGFVPIVSAFDQRTLLGGAFVVRLRTAYSEQVVQEVRGRVHGTAIRRIEGQTIKISVRY